ncbi:RICIN domain-containing protein, partial [Methylobacterium oxalidis]|uniref:RICIN domain-containing protein n=1 Tax=Methylobacterium oxalidis TaxID=944322 RepID=UPI0033152341
AAHSKLCLTVEGDATANFAVLKQQACTGRAAQTWSLRPSGYPGEVLVVNAATGKCLDNAGPTKLEEGARIIQ